MLPLKTYLENGYVITTDDVCLSNLKYFEYWDKLKQKYPELKIIAFTIANYKEREPINESQEFRDWFDVHRDWVEIGVHGYDHDPKNKPEWDRDNAEDLVNKSLDILKPFLINRPMYRAPGFQTTNQTARIIEYLGFRSIAYNSRIKYFNPLEYKNVFNTHCTGDEFDNPIGKIWTLL